MTTVLADASFYIAVLSRRDSLHPAARAFSERYVGRVVTTEYVLLEVANYLGSAGLRDAFI